MGCSISNDYSYIIDENVSFKVKPREEKVKIAGKEILLSTKVIATVLLNQLLQGSNYVFMKSIHNVIQEKGQDEVFELCEYINNASKVYYTDYIKFVKISNMFIYFIFVYVIIFIYFFFFIKRTHNYIRIYMYNHIIYYFYNFI